MQAPARVTAPHQPSPPKSSARALLLHYNCRFQSYPPWKDAMDLLALVISNTPRINPPEGITPHLQLVLRWIHFIAGITWVGLLYFFNLVNARFLQELDAPSRLKVVPLLMPRALWWFRW